MSGLGEMLKRSLVAAADLSGHQYRVIDNNGAVSAGAHSSAAGVLLNKPQSGEGASIGMIGEMKGIAGAAVASSAMLKVQSGGWLITATSGSGSVGRNLAAAVSSGETFTFNGNFLLGTPAEDNNS